MSCVQWEQYQIWYNWLPDTSVACVKTQRMVVCFILFEFDPMDIQFDFEIEGNIVLPVSNYIVSKQFN